MKWEYKFIICLPWEEAARLQHLGTEGWEMCGFVRYGYGVSNIWLKRPI